MYAMLKVTCLNVRGCNGGVKKYMIGDIMDERRMDVLVLSETKMRGKGEVVFGGARGRTSRVDGRMRAKEGVAIVLSEEMWPNVKEWKEVNSRMMWVRMIVGGKGG